MTHRPPALRLTASHRIGASSLALLTTAYATAMVLVACAPAKGKPDDGTASVSASISASSASSGGSSSSSSSSSSGPTGGSGGGGGSPSGCAPAETLCGGACVDTVTNDAHCGKCGHSCSATTTCDEGTCVACPPSFHAKVDYLTSAARHVAVADLDGDKVLDVVTSGTNAVSVLRGKAGGGVASKLDLPTDSPAGFVTPGDFDGDGKLDLATTVYVDGNGSAIEVLPGKGDGSFLPKVESPIALYVTSVAAGDFDGDGKLDLATGGYTASGRVIALHTNEGKGSFVTTVTLPVPTGSQPLVKASDLDGDGKLDLAMVDNSSHLVRVYLNAGKGTFAPSAAYPAAPPPFFSTGFTTGDFNGDGKPDLAVAGFDGNGHASLQLLLNQAAGTFPKLHASIATSWPLSLDPVDFDGDGHLDLVAAQVRSGPFDDSVEVFLGAGDGTFLESVEYVLGEEIGSFGIAAGDLDGDDRTDLVVPRITSVSVLFNGTCAP